MPDEVWKPHPVFAHYLVSNRGKIMSTSACARGRKHEGSIEHRKGKPIRRKVTIHHEGKRYYTFIHTMVLETFVGPRPRGMNCCHYDGNPLNNNLENLRWDTARANTYDAIRHGTLRNGVDVNTAKLTEDDVRDIRARYKPYKVTSVMLAKEYGVCPHTIIRIGNNQAWKHVA